jgi:hypothetical protein
MTDQTPLRISCQCPDDEPLEDCLVHFFLAERSASVHQLGTAAAPADPAADGPMPEPVPVPSDLPGDLAAAFAALVSAGFAPELVDVRERGAVRAS